VHGKGVGEVIDLQLAEEQVPLSDLSVSCFFLGRTAGLVDELLRFFSQEFVKETAFGHCVERSPVAPACMAFKTG
jgi:hypothetical protein